MVSRMNPVTIAHAAATAAVMFEGRFFLGVGTGERLSEQPLGQRWPQTSERVDQLREAIEVLRALWSGHNVNHRGEYWNVENLQLATLPARPTPIYVAASGTRSATLAGEIGDGAIGITPDGKIIERFRGAGGEGKPALAQLHVSLARTMDEAIDNAWRWWPNGAVPAPLLTEIARPKEFEAIADAVGRDAIKATVTCATDAASVVNAIDRFVGAGYDTVYLHQIGPDQQRLADLAARELLAHYRVS
jgi:G6PDH family F420-dependent oxidoreductase